MAYYFTILAFVIACGFAAYFMDKSLKKKQ